MATSFADFVLFVQWGLLTRPQAGHDVANRWGTEGLEVLILLCCKRGGLQRRQALGPINFDLPS